MVKKSKATSKEVAVTETHETALIVRPTADDFLLRAIDKGMSLEQLEKFIDLKNRQDAKIAKQEYLDAFSKFQGICPPLVKNKKASFSHKDGSGKTEYKFQELADIEKHVKPYLSQFGLSYNWGQREEGTKIHIWLILSHMGGHTEIFEPLSSEPDESGYKNSIQKKGSTITYLRRYTLTGGLGISSGDPDDDGKGAGQAEGDKKGKPLTANQFNNTLKKVMEGEWTLEKIKENNVLLTPDQESAIVKAEEEAKSKKA